MVEFINAGRPLYKPLLKWLAAAILSLPATSAVAVDETGRAGVIDGDTIEIHGTRFRLWGIDAPESNQLCRDADAAHYRCGAKAANSLHDFISGLIVNCVEVDRDRYRRSVSVCSVGSVDLADWMVRQGLALDWPQYSQRAYAEAQQEAQRHKRGIWQGSFAEPWRYRTCLRQPGKRPATCSDEAG